MTKPDFECLFSLNIGSAAVAPFVNCCEAVKYTVSRRRNNTPVVRHVQSLHEADDVSQTALHKAAMNGWIDCVVLLVDSGIDVNRIDICG